MQMEVSREAIRQTAGETRHVKVVYMMFQVPCLPTHQVHPAACPGGLARHNSSNSIFYSYNCHFFVQDETYWQFLCTLCFYL